MNEPTGMTQNPATKPAPTAPAETPRVNATVNQDDPKLQDAIRDFVGASGGEALAKEKVVVPPNEDFNMPNPNDVMITEALLDPSKLEITPQEKSLFVKAMLNDVPVSFEVTLFNGELKVNLRSRTVHEQRRIFDVLNKDQEDGIISKTDMAHLVTRMQQYCMVLMTLRVNGDVFSETGILPTASVVDSQKILHEAVKKVEGMNQIRWTALINAMRVFETKCARMSTEAANSDFWNPRG